MIFTQCFIQEFIASFRNFWSVIEARRESVLGHDSPLKLAYECLVMNRHPMHSGTAADFSSMAFEWPDGWMASLEFGLVW